MGNGVGSSSHADSKATVSRQRRPVLHTNRRIDAPKNLLQFIARLTARCPASPRIRCQSLHAIVGLKNRSNQGKPQREYLDLRPSRWTEMMLQWMSGRRLISTWHSPVPKPVRFEAGPEPVARLVPVLVVRWRPGLLTTQVGAGDHPGQDAQTAPHRLPLLCGVRRRSPPRRSPAIGRWILSVIASHPSHPASGRLMGQVPAVQCERSRRWA